MPTGVVRIEKVRSNRLDMRICSRGSDKGLSFDLEKASSLKEVADSGVNIVPSPKRCAQWDVVRPLQRRRVCGWPVNDLNRLCDEGIFVAISADSYECSVDQLGVTWIAYFELNKSVENSPSVRTLPQPSGGHQ